MTPRRFYGDLLAMALTHARRARATGDSDRARTHLCRAYWLRGRLRAVAPRPWGATVNSEQGVAA